MSARRRCQTPCTVVRATERSRLQSQCLGRAYELVLPVIRRVLVDNRSARTRSASLPIPQKKVGG
jgi:hypothetical protein